MQHKTSSYKTWCNFKLKHGHIKAVSNITKKKPSAYLKAIDLQIRVLYECNQPVNIQDAKTQEAFSQSNS